MPGCCSSVVSLQEDTSSSSSSRSSGSSRSSSIEPPPAPRGTPHAPDAPGAPRRPSAYGVTKAPSAAPAGAAAAAAAGAAASPGLQQKSADSWQQLAPGGLPDRGPPGGPPGPATPMLAPAVTLVMPEAGPGGPLPSPRRYTAGAPLQSPTYGKASWGAPGAPQGGPPDVSPRRGTRASFGLPPVPLSPRGAAVCRRTSEVDGSPGGPSRGPPEGLGKEAANAAASGCLLQKAATAGLRGVPCPRCHFVVPLQQIAQCADWQIRHGKAFIFKTGRYRKEALGLPRWLAS